MGTTTKSNDDVEGGTAAAEGDPPATADAEDDKPKDVKLYKSPRLKGYFTICLASGINYNAAVKSARAIGSAVPSTLSQRQYAIAVAVVSIILSATAVICHLDRFTPLRKFWIMAFQAKSKIELGLVFFLVLWWSVAVGVETTIGGIAGDGKEQFDLFFSSWSCCLASYWILERWWVDYGWASFKSFISSWPYRAPAWICIMILSLFTMIWYIDLWQNFGKLNQPVSQGVFLMFAAIPHGEWAWMVSLIVLTFFPAVAFVLVELFRNIKPDGSNEEKTKAENIVEGVVFLLLVLAWIPSIGIATTPGGIASLLGNAYFFSWTLVVFVFEGLVWWIHDYRMEIHVQIRQKANQYRKQQEKVLLKTKELQKARLEERRRREDESDSDDDGDRDIRLSEPGGPKRNDSSEFFDPDDEDGPDA